jgi:hypothetical protein
MSIVEAVRCAYDHTIFDISDIKRQMICVVTCISAVQYVSYEGDYEESSNSDLEEDASDSDYEEIVTPVISDDDEFQGAVKRTASGPARPRHTIKGEKAGTGYRGSGSGGVRVRHGLGGSVRDNDVNADGQIMNLIVRSSALRAQNLIRLMQT